MSEENKSYWIDLMKRSEEAIGSFRSAKNQRDELKEKMVNQLNNLRDLRNQGNDRLLEIDEKISFLNEEKHQVQKQIDLIVERIEEFEKP